MIKSIGLSILKAALLLGCILYLSVEAPVLHQKVLMNTVSKSIFKITPPGNPNTGGTGFQIDTPYGPKIVTNAHVCRLLKQDYAMMQDSRGRTFIAPVIKKSLVADLCMIEGNPKYPSLALGDGLDSWDRILVVGHPLLLPLTPSPGYVLGRSNVAVSIGPMDEESCSELGGILEDFFLFNSCVVKYDSMLTNAISYPGNSGSPAVDFFGRVVGVLFAGDSRTHHGILVPYNHIKNFIKSPY